MKGHQLLSPLLLVLVQAACFVVMAFLRASPNDKKELLPTLAQVRAHVQPAAVLIDAALRAKPPSPPPRRTMRR
jgi:hypothetical protein